MVVQPLTDWTGNRRRGVFIYRMDKEERKKLNFYNIGADIEPVALHLQVDCTAIVRFIMLKGVIV